MHAHVRKHAHAPARRHDKSHIRTFSCKHRLLTEGPIIAVRTRRADQ